MMGTRLVIAAVMLSSVLSWTHIISDASSVRFCGFVRHLFCALHLSVNTLSNIGFEL